ncbi:MAG: FAD binding domain-containing protein, partial [Candidatus Eisenbacteria bacterium]|nr:FAD binding domain-containing protein [Candidatus Eisenbacteria bacterium]
MSRFDHIMPESIEEAMALAATNGSRILAGGTDLLREIHAGSAEAARLVSLRAVPGLDRIERTPKGGLFIGARVTLAELGAHRDIRKEWTALSDAALGAASPPLRNVATIAGNLLQRPACEYYRTDFQCAMKGGIDCPARPGDNTHHAIFGGGACVSAHPSDAAAALLVLDARIHSNGPKGLRTRPVADLHRKPTTARPTEIALQPGDIITAIELPKAAGLSLYVQARERQAWAFALVGVAARLDINLAGRIRSARIALCGVAPIPWALPAVEAWLRGRLITRPGWA